MPVNALTALTIPNATLESFLYVLARLSGVFAFVPLPGFRAGAALPKIVLALSLTLVMMPSWPKLTAGTNLPGWLPFLIVEALLGLTAGVVLGWLIEGFVIAMQILGLQAGYAYASTIDPTTQADSSTLQVVAQLMASLLFLSSGLDRELLRGLAYNLEHFPPGSFRITPSIATGVIGMTASMLAMSVRLALPLVALLLMVDLALALLGRINSNLQLLTLAFPAKMLTSMAVLAILVAVTPSLFQESTQHATAILRRALGVTP
jgi:flagellar biosynthetic protein FliR